MKRTLTLILTVLMLCTLLFGCGQKSGDGDPQDTNTEPALADGVYTADFSTDSSMFHVNEACKGKGTLTVENGQMTIHISLPSKSILNLFCGTAEDAQKDGAALLQPAADTVTYSDGLSEEVNGFDIPVPALDEEFDVAIIGTKGKWYDHKVSVTNAVLKEDDAAAPAETLADGTYTKLRGIVKRHGLVKRQSIPRDRRVFAVRTVLRFVPAGAERQHGQQREKRARQASHPFTSALEASNVSV